MEGEKINNREIFDSNWARWQDMKFYGPSSRWLRSLVFDLLQSPDCQEIETVLDLGCGEGTNTFYLAKFFKNARVKGTDFSKTGIECAKSNYSLPNLEFYYDLTSESLAGKYDLVTCLEVLEHEPEWENLLARIAKASKKYVLLSFPVGRQRAFEKNVGHLRNFKVGQVEEYLGKMNFKPQCVFYAGFPFYSPLFRDVCNLINSAHHRFTYGKYGITQKVISLLVYFLFRYLSTQKSKGDQFCGLFMKV